MSATPIPIARNGLGLAAIILGLVGLLFGLVPLTGFIAVILGIVGLSLGIAGIGRVRRRQATNRWTTRLGVVASLAAIALGVWGMTIFFGAVDQLDRDLQEIGSTAEVATENPAPAPGKPAVPADQEVAATPIPEREDASRDTDTLGGDGTLVVGTDVQPGTYRTTGADFCVWERRSGVSGDIDEFLAGGVASGPTVVEILATDVAFYTGGCPEWTAVQ